MPGPVAQPPTGTTIGTFNPLANSIHLRINYIRVEHLIMLCVTCYLATTLAVYLFLHNFMGDKAFDEFPRVTSFVLLVWATAVPFWGEKAYIAFLTYILGILLLLSIAIFRVNVWLALSSPFVGYVLMAVSDKFFRRCGFAQIVLPLLPYGELIYFWARVITAVFVTVLARVAWYLATY